jgi:hypothetical protein
MMGETEYRGSEKLVGGSAAPLFTLASLEAETAGFDYDLTKRNYN